jgi:hypothetical protein
MEDHIINEILPKEKDTGIGVYCKICGYSSIPRTCECMGYNEAIKEVHAALPAVIEYVYEDLTTKIMRYAYEKANEEQFTEKVKEMPIQLGTFLHLLTTKQKEV